MLARLLRYLPVVQRDDAVAEARQLLAEPALSGRTGLPRSRGLRVVGQGEDQATEPWMRLADTVLTLAVPPIELLLSRSAATPNSIGAGSVGEGVAASPASEVAHKAGTRRHASTDPRPPPHRPQEPTRRRRYPDGGVPGPSAKRWRRGRERRSKRLPRNVGCDVSYLLSLPAVDPVRKVELAR